MDSFSGRVSCLSLVTASFRSLERFLPALRAILLARLFNIHDIVPLLRMTVGPVGCYASFPCIAFFDQIPALVISMDPLIFLLARGILNSGAFFLLGIVSLPMGGGWLWVDVKYLRYIFPTLPPKEGMLYPR